MLVALALLAIALATLWPMPGISHAWMFCLACGVRGTSDLLLNIALFMPLGAALALRRHRRGRIVVGTILLSSAIELAQFFIPGRDPTLGDVVANTLGAALGALIVQRADLWLSPPTAAAAWLCRGAAAAGALVCLITGLLLTPSRPASQYYGLWTPELGHLDSYLGRVLDATVNDLSLEPGPLPAPVAEVLRSPLGYQLRVRASAGPRPPPRGLAPLVAVFDDQQREILLVGVDREDVVLRERMRADRWRLDRPDLRVRIPPNLRTGDTLRVHVVARDGRYTINDVERGFTVGHGWGLLAYPDRLPFKTAINAMWIAAVFVPAGFWWRTRRDAVILALGVLGGLLFVPILTPLVLTPLVQWLTAASGLGLGKGLQLCTVSARLRRPTLATVC